MLAIAGVVALVACEAPAPAEQRFYRAIALDDGSVLLSGAIGRARKTPILARVAPAELGWRTNAAGYLTGENSVTTDGEIVAVHLVQSQGNGEPARVVVEGIDRSDGNVRWQQSGATLDFVDPELATHATPRVHIYAPSATAMWELNPGRSGKPPRELIAHEVRTGKTLRKIEVPLALDFDQITVLGPRIFLQDESRVVAVIGPDGRARTLEPKAAPGRPSWRHDGIGCAVGGDFVRFSVEGAQAGARAVMYVAPGGDVGRERRIALALDEDSVLRASFAGCAEYRGTIIVELTGGDFLDRPGRDAGWTRFLRFDREGTTVRAVSLPGQRAHARRYLEARLLDALPTRFFPILMRSPGRDIFDSELVVLDLEQMDVAWSHRRARRSDSHPQSLFHHDRTWYLATTRDSSSEWVAIDGPTGRVLAVQRVQCNLCSLGIVPVGPENVAGGAVWIVARDLQPHHKTPLVRLDARTLVPEYLSGDLRIEPDPAWWDGFERR